MANFETGTEPSADSLIELASQCVRCGLCLPHCPTYQLGREEPESPRGRIQMLAAFAKKELEWSGSLQTHMDQCLSCGHCERVCPIPVSYEKLLVQGREALAKQHPITWWKKLFIKCIEIPWLRKLPFKVAAWAKRQSHLSKSTNGVRPHLLTCGTCTANHDKILLFPGCTGESFGQDTFSTAQTLLTQLGYQVLLPPQSWCCGALSAHAGLGEKTTQTTLNELKALCTEKNIQHVVTFATGCGGWLSRQDSDIKIVDIQQFLLDHVDISKGSKQVGSKEKLRVAIHSPCTQTNALRKANLSYELLSKLTNLELIRFGENTCCGAAGLYMLEQPKLSRKLIAQLLTPELLANCDAIVTSNIGCQLHFQRYLKTKKINKPVCHPIEFLLR
ncbi:MAG: (Fe-S)-binding protein [Gammaproteobacteria bacterium]|jgi:glycolate oxidase iron-sulfur subunit|nr:(Fe-S)-binding protein [Gammaproteobacteria bacterium]